MADPEERSFTAAEVLPVLRVVWRNSPASVYVVHSHVFCSGLDSNGMCIDCGGGGCTSCCDPYKAENSCVDTHVEGVYLSFDAAKAEARALLRRLFVEFTGSPELLSRTPMSTQLPFDLGWNMRGRGERAWEASLTEREINRVFAVTVHKTNLAGVTKTRAAALLR